MSGTFDARLQISCLQEIPSPSSMDSLSFAKGADTGLLAMMEAAGYTWIDDSGRAQDALNILQSKGVNAQRIRVLVNPPADGIVASGGAIGFCDSASVVKAAQRAQEHGLRIMINFMYSDTWADPGHQAKPAAWADHNFAQLQTDVYNHTTNVLTALATVGIKPEWVQVGNEITGGLLWPEGKYDQFPQLTQLVNSGYRAVKTFSPTTKVVVQLDNGFKNSQYRWWFDNFTANGGQMDVIGMSCYPNGDSVDTLTANMQDVISRYGVPVIIAEFGMPSSDPAAANTYLVAVQKAVAALPNGQGLGVFYWEPEHAQVPGFVGYNLGAAKIVGDHTLQFTAAMNAFQTPVASTDT